MEGIGVDLAVMIIHIEVTVEGLQGAHHIEVAGIIHQGTLPMVVEDLGGRGPDHFLILHMVAQTGGMLVDLGDVFRSLRFEDGKQELCVTVMVP